MPDGKRHKPDFFAVELVIDNKNRTAIDADFRSEFANLGDTRLGAKAPSEKYIATTLGQTTLAFTNGEKFSLTLDTAVASGGWGF